MSGTLSYDSDATREATRAAEKIIVRAVAMVHPMQHEAIPDKKRKIDAKDSATSTESDMA